MSAHFIQIRKALALGISFWVVLLLGVLNRMVLFRYNMRYTDDYIEPIQMWLNMGTKPLPYDCWECFHPPLFSACIRFFADLMNYTTRLEIFQTIQLFNFTLSIFILLLVLLFIKKIKLSGIVEFAVMLFWAINPELVSTSVLGSNDNLAILLGILLTQLLLKSYIYQQKSLVGLVSLTILGVATKGTMLVFLGFTVLILLYRMVLGQKSILNYAKGVLTLIILIGGSAYLGGYTTKHQLGYDVFKINQERRTPPKLLEKTPFDGRPGVESVSSAFFTFQYLSLFQQPYNNYHIEPYPKHRTSMFTQFYAQYSGYFFDRHPHYWIPQNKYPDLLAMGNFAIQLPLFVLFIYGLVLSGLSFFRRKEKKPFVYLAIFTVYMLFMMAYVYQYRDYAFMKYLYTLPGILAYIYLFTVGLKGIRHKIVAVVLMLISCTLYLAQSYFLVISLASDPLLIP